MKKIFNIFTLAALVVFIGYLAVYAAKPANKDVSIHFLNVGQGDATFIELPGNQNILIDGGPVGSEKELDKYEPFFNRTIKNLIITHPHLDHFGGLLSIVKDYRIENIYMTKATNKTPEFEQLLSEIKGKNIRVSYVKKGDAIEFEQDIKLRFLFPSDTNYNPENLNDTSIVSELDWGSRKALFMGDMEADVQYKILDLVSKVDVLKVSHHCSTNAFDTKLYQKIMPQYAVISVGKGNAFGHPAKSCLDTMKSSQIYRTDQDGDISFDMSRDSLTPAK